MKNINSIEWLKLLDFLKTYPNQWHGYATDKETTRALEKAMQMDSRIELSTISKQMRWNG